MAYSDSATNIEGGSLGWRRGAQLPSILAERVGRMKVGEVSEPIRTQYGYHLIRVEKRDHTPFEQVKPVLERNERQAKLQAMLDAMKTNAKATFDEKYFPTPEPPKEPQATPTAAPAPEKKP